MTDPLIPDGMVLLGDGRVVPLNPPVTVTTPIAAIVMSGVVVSTNLPLNP